MLNDIHGGNPRGMAFKDYLESRGKTIPIPGFEVRVLTTGFWPLYPMMKINVPAEMQDCMTAYTDHYMSHTNHRTLNWVHRLGFATVRANFKKWYDLQVTTLQAMVMLQFNSGKDRCAMPMRCLCFVTTSCGSGSFCVLILHCAQHFSDGCALHLCPLPQLLI